MVRLEKITENNYKDCFNLKVTEDQKDFVSSTMKSLALSYVYYDVITPFAIYNDDVMVGFIMIRLDEEDGYYFIWQLLIDEKYQHKGYGKETLKLAINWMKKDGRCKDIVTTYIIGNDHAKNLYTQFGFERMNDIEDGEIDLILHL